MMKVISTAAIVSTILIASAFAQGTAQAPTGFACDEPSLARMDTMANGMTDATKKAAAMKHAAAMREAMMKKDMASCTTLLKDTNNYFPNTVR
jgi:hypothetical protein